MSRPTTLLEGNTLYWTATLYSSSGVLVDADSLPTVAVRKNGASTADAVTVTKRAATTGIYDCSYSPAGEVGGDQYQLEETAVIAAATYVNPFSVIVEAPMRGTDGSNTVAPNTIAPDNAGIAANATLINALNDFNPATDVVANVTLVATTTDLTNSATVQEIVDGVWDELSGSHTTADTFGAYLDAQVSSAGSGGTGLYQATVRVQDTDTDSLQGARVNVDGTTLTLTTGTSGEVTFNLDSGVYLIDISPPAGFETPVSQVLTVSGTDPSNTVYTLSPNTSCGTNWVG